MHHMLHQHMRGTRSLMPPPVAASCGDSAQRGRRGPLCVTLSQSPVSKPAAHWRLRQGQEQQSQPQRQPAPHPTLAATGPTEYDSSFGAGPTAKVGRATSHPPQPTTTAGAGGWQQPRPQAGTQQAAATGAPLLMTPAQMAGHAASNQAAVSAALAAAAAAGRPPLLRELLVEPSWVEVLGGEFDKPYMVSLQGFLEREWVAADQQVLPAAADIFRAFNSVPFDQVRVVILGQDPYPTPGDAMGLSFSVAPGRRTPPSLRNIYKELEADCGLPRSSSGDLTPWCQQGVLLLNAVLTVRRAAHAAEKTAGSHAGQGWEAFTDAAMAALSARRQGLVFLLWGKVAQAKGAAPDTARHHVLTAPHPAARPRGDFKGFSGCNHFSKTNQLLQQSGQAAIDWRIS